MPPGIDPAEIRACADVLIASPAIAPSVRRARLLRYLIDRTLAGEGSQITEYGIGLDVFEKPPTFDPRMESIVRTESSRLRQKLKEYYAAEGRLDRILINLPSRSYVPVFTFSKPEAALSGIADVKRNRHLGLVAAFGIVGGLTAGLLVWNFNRAAGHPIGSLVVLPFQSLSADRRDDYLADGVTEELTNDVAQWKDIRIVARTSAAQFKDKGTDIREIGRKLKVDAVLEGSVAKQGDRIRITAQLNHTSDGYHLWSKAYDARSEDIMAVQQEIAQSIAATVRKLGGQAPQGVPRAPTTNPEALDLYLQGSYQRSRLTPDSLKRSVALFEASTRKDPTYARAFLALAGSEYELVSLTSESPFEGEPRAKVSLRKVLELDPRNADAHALLAKIAYDLDWTWPSAEREFQSALEQGARSDARASYGWALATRGRFSEAQAECQAAESSDPLGFGPRSCQFWTWYLQRKYPEARSVLRGMLDLNPDSLYAHALLGLIAAIQHDCGESQTQFGWVASKYAIPVTKIGLAYASACAGERERASRYLKEATTAKGLGYTSPYQLAIGYAFLDDKEAAIRYLRKSADDREGQIHYLKYDPVFDGIRSDPRYIELERMVGLDP
jgi:TolB-like protein